MPGITGLAQVQGRLDLSLQERLYWDLKYIDSNKLSICPISAFRPRRWKGKIVSDKSTIVIKNLSHIKRPISAVADNIEIRNAKNIEHINKIDTWARKTTIKKIKNLYG